MSDTQHITDLSRDIQKRFKRIDKFFKDLENILEIEGALEKIEEELTGILDILEKYEEII